MLQSVDSAAVTKAPAPAPILAVRAECSRLPLPASPEYIALKQTRQRKMSESLTNLREEIRVSVSKQIDIIFWIFQIEKNGVSC